MDWPLGNNNFVDSSKGEEGVSTLGGPLSKENENFSGNLKILPGIIGRLGKKFRET